MGLETAARFPLDAHLLQIRGSSFGEIIRNSLTLVPQVVPRPHAAGPMTKMAFTPVSLTPWTPLLPSRRCRWQRRASAGCGRASDRATRLRARA
jgi:hypothetical protein